MSGTDQFWRYAKEAVLAASYAESDDEKQGLLDLAQTWTQAALIERRTKVDTSSMAEACHTGVCDLVHKQLPAPFRAQAGMAAKWRTLPPQQRATVTLTSSRRGMP